MAIAIESGDILSSEQLNTHVKIYAGPGAGKTHFLVENLKNIVITNPLVAKSRSRKVLCITYTNAAVDEIKHRLGRFSDTVETYTIHSFIIEHIIKPFQQDLREIMMKDFGITVHAKGKITSQVEGLGILHGVDKDAMFKFIVANIGEASELSYSKKIMGEVEVDNDEYLCSGKMQLKASKSILENHRLPIKNYVWSVVQKLTHNEILYFGYRILQRNHTALYVTRVKFPFIFVDEFQDTNPLQTLLIKLIGEKSTFIGVIGDIAQSIYSFQGAKPSQFAEFTLAGCNTLTEYAIGGNRRSTTNIVNLCGFLRQSDKNIIQTSIKPYKSDVEEAQAEEKKIHIIYGESDEAKKIIGSIIDDGGVVLTRSWAAAFAYIQNITVQQVECLKKIYNAYYTSPIDIRSEISEHNNVTWVRAFKFIFRFWNGYQTGSLIEMLGALSLFSDFDKKKLTPKIISQLKKLSEDIFANIDRETVTVNIINIFNSKLNNADYTEFGVTLFGNGFTIPILDEEDRDDIKNNVPLLNWKTSYKLFTEVFSDGSRYMTVHQAKGREWEKVVVSLEPNKAKNRDNTTLSDMFLNPLLLKEEPAQEFTRMYYVACSRAKEDLYIHLKNQADVTTLKSMLNSYNQTHSNGIIEYETTI